MLQQGIDPKIVQERLGHANIPATLHTYSHVLPGLQEAAAQRFDEGLVLSRDEPLASSFRAEAVGRVGGQNLVPGVGFEAAAKQGEPKGDVDGNHEKGLTSWQGRFVPK